MFWVQLKYILNTILFVITLPITILSSAHFHKIHEDLTSFRTKKNSSCGLSNIHNIESGPLLLKAGDDDDYGQTDLHIFVCRTRPIQSRVFYKSPQEFLACKLNCQSFL